MWLIELKRWSEHLGWTVLSGSREQALHPSPCHPQTFCLTSHLCNPLTHSHTQPLLSPSHSLDTTHTPTHPLSLKYFLLLWFSCRCLPSGPCVAQHPLLPGTSTLPLQTMCRAEAFPFIVPAAPAAPPSSRLFPAITHLEWK